MGNQSQQYFNINPNITKEVLYNTPMKKTESIIECMLTKVFSIKNFSTITFAYELSFKSWECPLPPQIKGPLFSIWGGHSQDLLISLNNYMAHTKQSCNVHILDDKTKDRHEANTSMHKFLTNTIIKTLTSLHTNTEIKELAILST